MSELGILVPLAGIGVGALAVWTRHQRRLVEMGMTVTAEKAAQYASQHRALEERVRVLERIITDGGFDTALQIEALRDQRAVERTRDGPQEKGS
ncbi:hypothetical protein [Novosphingobium colocasiae]|uniref:Uncharacterized protein n=2 Tax=Bacteria TaxID=2 RepID=A0A918UKH4_9SPHN|nr:hypothetical protein [Novosphingobium colocasiae]GGZ16287.1 hypothetical protein GCM10011614_33840 [Novosphingobium colocasiae]